MSRSNSQFSLDIRKRKVREYQKRYQEAARKLEDLNPTMKKVSVYLDQWVQRNFQTQGGKVGGWQPFVESNPRIAQDPSAKLLQDTGALRRSFLPFATGDNAGIGSDLPYSEPHNAGWGHLPQRRLLPKKTEVNDDVSDIIRADVNKIAGELNGRE